MRREASEQAILVHTTLTETLVVIYQEHSEDMGRLRVILANEQGIIIVGGPDLTRLEKRIEEIRALSA